MKDVIFLPQNRFTWSLLAFQGGFVNMGGLLTVHIFVSHITGFAAHFSSEILVLNFIKAFYFVSVPLFFLFGGVFSALFTEIRRKRNQSPVYIHILSLLSLIYFLISWLGYFGFFGKFGEPFKQFHDFALLSLLSFSCGAQNAIFTHYSGSIIRTTHLTGVTTDLGIGLAKYFVAGDHKEGQFNRMRIEIIFAFIVGSLLAGVAFMQIQFLGFLIPGLISALVGMRLYRSRKKLAF